MRDNKLLCRPTNLPELAAKKILVINRLGQRLIRIYRKFPVLLPSRCIFEPTCSEYAMQALEKFSFPRALTLIIWRLLRCHPFNRGGIDQLP
jgi:hypothetical protein